MISMVLCTEGSFFFQAEDGIRDRDVTGVQTCALPISRWRSEPWRSPRPGAPGLLATPGSSPPGAPWLRFRARGRPVGLEATPTVRVARRAHKHRFAPPPNCAVVYVLPNSA